MRMRNGSALIFVALLLSFTAIFTMLMVRKSSLYLAFSLDRLSHTKNILALDMLLEYAAARVIAQKHPQAETHEETITAWGPFNKNYTGTVSIEPKAGGYQLHATLVRGRHTLGESSCMVHLKDQEYTIHDWHYK